MQVGLMMEVAFKATGQRLSVPVSMKGQVQFMQQFEMIRNAKDNPNIDKLTHYETDEIRIWVVGFAVYDSEEERIAMHEDYKRRNPNNAPPIKD